MPKPILILLAGKISPSFGLTENFADMFIRQADYSQGETVVFPAYNRTPPKKLDSYGGIIVTGSLAMVTRKSKWSQKLGETMARAHEQKIPLLGVCYGHQLLADTLGGVVDYHPKGKELGTFTIYLKENAHQHHLLKDIPPTFKANLSHSQSVLVPPQEAKVLAQSDHDGAQILAYGERTLTLQFHPEFDGSVTRAFANGHNKTKKLEPPLSPDTPEKPGFPIEDTPHAVSILQNFVNFCYAPNVDL
ncbi:MAG: glutamine amidotransferase [Deltaproteobacteria bacterium]|nr:glutamine amidotransferase [Deltaproteobacteria bacterium]